MFFYQVLPFHFLNDDGEWVGLVGGVEGGLAEWGDERDRRGREKREGTVDIVGGIYNPFDFIIILKLK